MSRLPAFLLALLLAPLPAAAQFAVNVAPARFELQAKPGQVLRESLEIGNDDLAVADYSLRTSDWTLNRDGGVEFQPDILAPDSCRPWVRIERYKVRVGGKSRRKYRFEVHVPADARDGLCRFALLIEPGSIAMQVSPIENIQMPLQGRVGVIVYVRVGNARPALAVERLAIEPVNGRPTPVAFVRNEGTAQGRADGVLEGSDAKGRSFELVVSPLPVLPGETRRIPLWPQEPDSARKEPLSPPFRIKGTIEWEGGQAKVDTQLP